MPTFLKFTILLLATSLALMGCQKDEESEHAHSHILRVASNQAPHALDPRSGRLLADATALNMLYEGLMRLTPSGHLEPGIAESVEISDDGTIYTFHLRDSRWSNGEPVTAQDFAYSWKSQLEPSAPAPNAFVFYPILHARDAKAGLTSLDHVGIAVLDPHTLVVELESPTPHFLDLTAFYAMFPVHALDPREDGSLSNGPFKLQHYSPTNELVVVKNPEYWNKDIVKLDQIRIAFLDENTSLSLFEEGSLDWIGSPLSTLPTEAFFSLPSIKSAPAAATHWLRFNVDGQLTQNQKLRKALALAINRDELMGTILHGNQQPALALIPPLKQWNVQEYFSDHDVNHARKLLSEALREMRLEDEGFLPLTLIYVYTPRTHQIMQALQQQWMHALGIWVDLQPMESKEFYHRLKAKDYQIANGSWFADFEDPINFLEVFAAKDNGTNNTGWENRRYSDLLYQSSWESDPRRRIFLLQQAEAILMDEMPVVPLFFYSLNYVKMPDVQDVGISPTGIQIFRSGWKKDHDE